MEILGQSYVYRFDRNRHIVLKRSKPIYISTNVVYSYIQQVLSEWYVLGTISDTREMSVIKAVKNSSLLSPVFQFGKTTLNK